MRKTCLLSTLLLAIPLAGQELSSQNNAVKEFDLAAKDRWLDTGLDVAAGDTMKFTVTGTVQYAGSKPSTPEGSARGWKDLLRPFPLNDAGRGAVIGRVGTNAAARPFLIASARESKALLPGRLFVRINQPDNDSASGNYRVKVEIAKSSAAPRIIDESKLPKLTQQILDQLPARVVDAEGTPGDRSNFLVIGAEEQVTRALELGGWVKVNRTPKDAVIQAALATFSKQAYVQLPMSELMMFGRAQDYGYALGDPLIVVAARHHFRLWKAPVQVDGHTLWVGAGTHDVGFDRDQRNGKLTHKIDPDTDKERDFIGQSLKETGLVAKLDYVTHANTFTKSKTAHGQEFTSDGRTLIVTMIPDETDATEGFADMFCTVLKESNPDGGDWGECSKYLDTASKKKLSLGPISNKYRVLIVPGLMNTCFSGAPAYKEGQAYLKEKHGLTVELLSVPNDSSEENARLIAGYLQGRMPDDKRKYIVLGYSKGAPDLQVALSKERGVAQSVAAFISVAGAVGGSPIADAIPAIAEKWIQQYNLPNCKGNLAQGFKSLSQSARRTFNAGYPSAIVPTYSLPAISDESNTSTMLKQAWTLLSAFDSKHDSQLTMRDAIVPGSKYLGSALADHFALALPFESSEEAIKSVADKNRYPRSALLEAMVRFVIQDLETRP